MVVDASLIQSIAPLCPASKVDTIASAAGLVFSQFDGLGSRVQRAHFLAQVSHETGQFRWMKELGGSDYFRSNYEHRDDLGNNQPGDGEKYCGRGWVMATGRALYHELSQHFGIDFLANPYLLEKPEWAAKSAGYFWDSRGCGSLAVDSSGRSLEAVTRRLNGGTNGLTERAIAFGRALTAMEVL